MTCDPTPSIIERLKAWPATVGVSRAGRRAAAVWADDPVLSRFSSPGAAADAVSSDSREAAVVLGALVNRPGDDWAATAALAGLAGRLSLIVRRWARRGLVGRALVAAEADLVAAVVDTLVTRKPTPAPDAVVTAAWQRVYGARRTEANRAARRGPLSPDMPSGGGNEPTAVETLLALLADSLRRRRIPLAHAQSLAARATGCSTTATAKLAGVGVSAIRARRRRGLAALVAANAVWGGGW